MNKNNLLALTIIILIVAIPIFGHLSERPMERWDEARLAIKAYEMNKSGNWIVPTYMYAPDNWSAKPPMLIWFEALSTKLLGVNTLAVRLPSALAAFFTCMLLYWFLAKKYKNRVIAVVAPSILIVFQGYVIIHGTRTGDYDALLTLWTTAYLLYYYVYLTEKKSKYLLLTTIALIFACLTKGIAGLFFMPALLIMTVVFKETKELFTNKTFYISIALFIIAVPGYYLLREHVSPGYLIGVWQNELGGRYTSVIEQHKGLWYFYFVELYERDSTWLVFILWGFLLSFKADDITIKKLAQYMSVVLLFYILVISKAQTKLYWYLLPIYPIAAIIASIGLHDIYKLIVRAIKKPIGKTLPIVAFLALYGVAYGKTLNYVLYAPPLDITDPSRHITEYLDAGARGKKDIKDVVLLYEESEQDLLWYSYALLEEYNVSYRSIPNLFKGDKVLSYRHDVIGQLNETYSIDTLDVYYNVHLIKILDRK